MNYLPFDLETALKHPERVITRDGRKVKELYYFKTAETRQPLCGVDSYGYVECWDIEGNFSTTPSSNHDLFLLPEVKECWINVYENINDKLWTGNCFPTKERAESEGKNNPTYIKTIRITNEPE